MAPNTITAEKSTTIENNTAIASTDDNTSTVNTRMTLDQARGVIAAGRIARRNRIHRSKSRLKEMGVRVHPGTTTRIAMNKRLTATQFYRLQSQLPAQVPYIVQDTIAAERAKALSAKGSAQ